eukprot:1159733-Pelagomonas_calceolata.AAC.10
MVIPKRSSIGRLRHYAKTTDCNTSCRGKLQDLGGSVACFRNTMLMLPSRLQWLAGRNKMKDWDVNGTGQDGEDAVGGQVEAQSDSDAGDDDGW